jgi:hypothetical protein
LKTHGIFGNSKEKVKDMLMSYGYAEKTADAVIEDYFMYGTRKSRFSNNLLAIITISLSLTGPTPTIPSRSSLI